MNRPEKISAHYLNPLKPIPTRITPVLSNMRTYDAILFDVYGTLLVSGAGEIGMDPNNRAGRDLLPGLLQRYGIERTPRELRNALTHAIASEHRVQKNRGVPFPEVDILHIWQKILNWREGRTVKRFAMEYEWITNPVFPMPGAATVIHSCMAEKVPLGVISNAQFYTVGMLKDLFGEELYARGFDPKLRFFSWRERHAKPSETMFRRALQTLETMGVMPESVLYVGNDMLNDVRPAAAVGFQTALFAGDRRSLRMRDDDERCRGLRPDMVITDLRQLLPAIGTGKSEGYNGKISQ